MNIFISFLQSKKNHAIPAYSFWEYYIKNGITEAGHQWHECTDVDWALGIVPKSEKEQSVWLADTWEKTIAYLKKNPVDLFLCYLYPKQVSITAINEINTMGIPTVNFFCDNVRQFKNLPVEFSVFSLNWVPEHKALSLYKKANYPHISLPMPMWVSPQYRVVQAESDQKISFVGSNDIQRQRFFEEVVLLTPDIPLEIYGKGWEGDFSVNPVVSGSISTRKIAHQYNFIKANGIKPYWRKLSQRNNSIPVTGALQAKIHGSPNFDGYVQLTAKSMIIIGINRYPSFHFPLDKPDTYSRLRDIEAPMLGACYLTEYTEGLDELYDIGDEIEIFKTTQEFIDKIARLTADKSKREALKRNGQKRALNDHGIPQSLNKIINRLEL